MSYFRWGREAWITGTSPVMTGEQDARFNLGRVRLPVAHPLPGAAAAIRKSAALEGVIATRQRA